MRYPTFGWTRITTASCPFHLANGIGSGLGYRTKHWMPGFPHVLSWLIGVFGLDFLKLKLSIVAFGVGAYAATFAYVRCIAVQLPHRHLIAWVVALSTAVSPLLFDYSHRLMSGDSRPVLRDDSGLWLCEVVRRSQSTRMLVTAAVALSALCVLAVLMRGNGLGLVPALLLSAAYDWRARRRATIACGVAATLTLALFVGWSTPNANRALPKAFTTSRISRRSRRATWARSGKPEGSSKASSASPLRDLGPPHIPERSVVRPLWHRRRCRAGRSLPGRGRQQSSRYPFSPSLPWSRSSSARSALRGTLQREMMYLVATLVLALAYPGGDSPRMLIASVPLLQVAAFFGIASIGSLAGALAWTTAVSAALFAGTMAAADRQAKSPDHLPRLFRLLRRAHARLSARASTRSPGDASSGRRCGFGCGAPSTGSATHGTGGPDHDLRAGWHPIGFLRGGYA